MTRIVSLGITIFLLASCQYASAQTAETILNELPVALPDVPLRISVAADGSSIVSLWYRESRFVDPFEWAQLLSPDGTQLGPDHDQSGWLNVHFALDQDRWAVLTRRDSVSGWINENTQTKYHLTIRNPWNVVDSTDTLFYTSSRSQIGDEAAYGREIESMQTQKSGARTLLCADTRCFYIPGGADYRRGSWQEHEWVLWRSGSSVIRHSTGPSFEVVSETEWHPGTDILIGGFSESGTPYLVHREQLKKDSPLRVLTRIRLDDSTGAPLAEDVLDTLVSERREFIHALIAYDDGAVDLPMLFPSSDTLVIRRYDAAGTFLGEVEICREIYVLRDKLFRPDHPDYAYLRLNNGRHLFSWSRKEGNAVRLYLSVFDADWRLMDIPYPVSASSPGDQLRSAVALHSDTLAVAWMDNGSGDWAVMYRRIPLDMIVGIHENPAPAVSDANLALLDLSPHPARDHAMLRYRLHRSAFLRLQLFDTMGRLISTIRETQAEPGTHGIPTSTAGIPPGLYFLRMTGGGELHTRPLIVQ